VIQVALCDDNKDFTEKMKVQLAQFAEDASVGCEIRTFHDGKDLARAVSLGTLFDLIFLDIEMEDMDGLKAAAEIRKVDKAALIIYVSSHSKYAIEAYNVRPFQFLVKPFEPSLLKKYFDAALQELIEEDVYFRYKKNKQDFKILLKDILYFESKAHTVKIACANGEHSYRERLDNIEKALDQSQSLPKVNFWRIHQSYLVNSRYIWQVEYSKIEMSNGDILQIAESKRKHIREKFLKEISENAIG